MHPLQGYWDIYLFSRLQLRLPLLQLSSITLIQLLELSCLMLHQHLPLLILELLKLLDSSLGAGSSFLKLFHMFHLKPRQIIFIFPCCFRTKNNLWNKRQLSFEIRDNYPLKIEASILWNKRQLSFENRDNYLLK